MTDEHPNPYASPQAVEQRPIELPGRQLARQRIRWTLLVLLIPTWCNFAAVFFLSPPDFVSIDWIFVVVANIVCFSLLFVFLWMFALRVLEAFAGGIRALLADSVPRDVWLNCFYHALWPMTWAARIGAMLWLVWLYLFFFAGHPGGFSTDAMFQLAAHALGFWVYGNVCWQWFKVAREYHGKPSSMDEPLN